MPNELRSVQIEDDEMEMSDDDRDSRCSSTKKARFDSDSLKEENDSLRCQLDAMRNEMFLNRSELKQDSDFREKQIKVLQETIRNMQTQLLKTKMREEKEAKLIEKLKREFKEARVCALLLQTQLKEARSKQKENKHISSSNASIANEESIPNSIEEKSTHENNDEKETENNYDDVVETNKAIEINIAEMHATDDIAEAYLIDNDKNIGSFNIESDNDDDEDEENDDDDDVHFVSVKQQETRACNGASTQDTTLVLDDNDVVLLVEEEDEDKTKPQTNNISLDETDKDIVLEKAEDATNSSITDETEFANKLADEETAESKSLKHFEARIIALVAAYLVVQPFGAYSSAICCYLSTYITSKTMEIKLLEQILSKYKNLFVRVELETTTDSCCEQKQHNIELKWKFRGFIEANEVCEVWNE